MRMLTKASKTLLLAGVLILSACATYQAPRLPAGEYARVVLPRNHMGSMTSFDLIDGVPPSMASALDLKPSTKPVVLAPGKHTLRIQVQYGLSRGKADLWLVAEAGKTYRVEKATKGYRFVVWLVDGTTGQVVGGNLGSDDEPTGTPSIPEVDVRPSRETT